MHMRNNEDTPTNLLGQGGSQATGKPPAYAPAYHGRKYADELSGEWESKAQHRTYYPPTLWEW